MNINFLKNNSIDYRNSWISSQPLAWIRICISMLMIFEAFQIIYFSELIYGLGGSPIVKPIIYIWILALTCVALGLYTKYAAIVSYFLTTLIIGAYDDFEYHIDYVYITTSLLFIFYPIDKSLSLDNWLKKRPSQLIPRLYNDSFIIIFIAIIYIDSCFYKLTNNLWTEGLGWWLPASTTYASFLNINFLLNQEFLVKLMGYATVLFELVFIFVFWLKPVRPFLFLSGVMLHIGILFSFPIPFFAIAMTGIYFLFLPDPYISRWFKLKSICNLKEETRPVKIFNPATVSIFLVVFIQSFIILSTESWGPSWARKIYRPIHREVTRFTGLTRHPVFVDYHFRPFKSETAVVYVTESKEEIWLPLTRKNGQPGWYPTGRFWVQWNFRAIYPGSEMRKITSVKKWILFWTYKNKIQPQKGHFEIKSRPLEIEFSWKKDKLKNQMELEWATEKIISWQDLLHSPH